MYILLGTVKSVFDSCHVSNLHVDVCSFYILP
jgi:hypothetical protein